MTVGTPNPEGPRAPMGHLRAVQALVAEKGQGPGQGSTRTPEGRWRADGVETCWTPKEHPSLFTGVTGDNQFYHGRDVIEGDKG